MVLCEYKTICIYIYKEVKPIYIPRNHYRTTDAYIILYRCVYLILCTRFRAYNNIYIYNNTSFPIIFIL